MPWLPKRSADLAARSAKAAKETAELIESSVGKVENGSQIAAETERALQEIVDGVIKANSLVIEIAAASNEQSHGIGQVNQGLGQIDQVTQQNTANAEESAAVAEELSGQSEQLRQMLSRFKLTNQSGKPIQLARRSSEAQTITTPNNLNRARHPAHPIPAPGFAMGESKSSRHEESFGPDMKDPREIIALDDGEFGKY